ncbi:energy-coupling factor transporter transmembrane component T family protein [Arthrobacter sp. CDRTa11]|uniref:energy-coupling factor transporter transmembrane component T family protein n=1 Tax=Arthrobacter sp. CDRTa11 TaxID=2651199 RepID=UPI002265DBF4|nr:energy-coupling factor transporter transmembrane component T [Arthrobacter sp. CDRTa11]
MCGNSGSWPDARIPRLGRISPLTQLTAVVTAVVVTTAVGQWVVSLSVLAAAAAITAIAGTARAVGAAAGLVLLPLAASLLLTHGLFFPEGNTVLWTFGPARLTAEGLGVAGSLALRAAVLVVLLLTLSFSIQPADIMALCAKHGVPAQLGFVLCSTLTIAPQIKRRVQRIREAQQLRGLYSGNSLPARLASFRVLALPLLLSLLHDAGQRAAALETRGFGGTAARTSLRAVPDSRFQSVLRWSLLAGTAVFLVLWFGPGGGSGAPQP